MKAVFSGSFDPITRGHVDIVERASHLFHEIVVGVAVNSAKNGIFTMDERVAFVRDAVKDLDRVSVAPVDGLLVEFCEAHGADVIVRGLRFGGDFDYELQMAHLNKAMGDIETVLLPAGREFGTISSSMIRSAAANGGDVGAFVTPMVDAALRARFGA
ncbi:pantetheine-phosphate adenylyltransferase [Acidipropionibacterium timonense]|uniref:pantetheine-phosphate adenylyltransferase n=1 Tax=Acidipropionibacterium timonense TaxID=2161818 RepID=UPI001031589B|nr:pantetheine-phosphate adenylyltransferase [Acidipropionibacterium timonense]